MSHLATVLTGLFPMRTGGNFMHRCSAAMAFCRAGAVLGDVAHSAAVVAGLLNRFLRFQAALGPQVPHFPAAGATLFPLGAIRNLVLNRTTTVALLLLFAHTSDVAHGAAIVADLCDHAAALPLALGHGRKCLFLQA